MTVERERRYGAEYMKKSFSLGNFSMNVPLGPIPKETIEQLGLTDAANFIRPYRRRIDAVAWLPGQYILIEFKIRDALEGIGRLQTYRDLARLTPDLPEYRKQDIEAWLVTPWALDWIQAACVQANIRLVIEWQDWIADYVKERQNYFRADYRIARAEKLRMRRLLGVE